MDSLTRLLRWLCLVACVAFATAVATNAHASQKAAAESLFQEGKRLMEAGQYEEACQKFEASQKADASVGALLNLARCHEVLGKNASAWVEYKEAAKLAAQTGQADREQGARDLASKIEPKLSKITIQVTEQIEGLEVKRGGEPVPSESWGTAIAVDPGTYTIQASAPGRRTWSDTITIGGEADQQTVLVPALDMGDGSDTGGGDTAGPNSLAIAGYVVGGVGVVVLALGTAAGIVAINKEKDLADNCGADGKACQTQDDIDDAQLVADLSTAGIAIGAACLVGGIVMIVIGQTSSDSTESATVAPMIGPAVPNGSGPDGPSVMGLAVSGRF